MPLRLALFFTDGVSLADWDRVGMLDREVAVYERLRDRGVAVSFVTYGGRHELDYRERLPGIELLPLRAPGVSARAVAQMLALHGRRLGGVDVAKTNQVPGAQLALVCKRLFRSRLVVRAGYPYSLNTRESDAGDAAAAAALRLEGRAVAAVDALVVTTARAREYMLHTHGVEPARVRVIPNYVVTDVFRPMPDVEKRYDVVFVGRGSPEKNLPALLDALALLAARGRRASLLLVGGASNDSAVLGEAEARGVAVTPAGNVANFALPGYLNAARAFVLPSLYEGHPKALLEAMSCGLPCIGSRVRGIADVIREGETGLLCEPDAASLAAALEGLLARPAERERLGAAARSWVERELSLDRVVETELSLLREVAGAGRQRTKPTVGPSVRHDNG